MTNERILIMNQPNILILHLDELRQEVCMCTSMLHGTTIVHCPPAIRLFQSSCVKTDTKPPQSEKCT